MKVKQARRAARDMFRFCVRDGVLDDTRARQVAGRLAASRRRGALAVLSGFQRLVRLERDRHTARVESATPLGGSLRDGIKDRLVHVYGPTLATSFDENPALIGGVRIKVGSDVYDGSIRGRLAALEAKL
jgi:F-type H+-transporting ATPase subunit delta